ncbi:hypothetical protein [Pedobacter xixiisoli]|uniref:Uncharacterized protein n=1 Tax=Pedobacter xixiisoli TaxID=1476464 RepID=A0A286A826_9SPHI|nr:hypothetical protein [Pedobacter xixiisoli]SOD18064.1 hypothetical protein SAMN06297358_2809 [Pedobacter xixiisoli]
MKKYIYLSIVAAGLGISTASAQVYVAKVSKDSVGVLTGRLEALKISQKIQELKIDEAKEEAEVEKLRVKLLEANDKAKESAAKSSGHISKTGSSDINIKETEKLAKKAKNDMEDSQKALDRFNKQIRAVEKVRAEIQTEERKAGYKKPLLSFNYQ